MRSCFVLLFASLLTSCEAQGTIEPPVFVLKGRDLLLKLHADPPERFIYVDWKINKTVTLVRFDPSGKAHVVHSFTGGFEFPENKFSMILKNLQEADSGVYSAVAATSTGDKLVAEYKVTVQGPVSPVKLTVDRVESSSSESCDLHVTCRTHNSDISSIFRCVDRVCSQEGGERSEVTTSGASLQVYLLNSTIICNHRNKVHWTQDLVHAKYLCPSKPDLHSGWVAAICILILMVIMFVGLFFWLHHRQRRIISEIRSLEASQENTSAPPWKLRPADYAADLGRRFEDFVRAVVLRSAPPQDESPADYSDLGKGFEDLVHEALQRLTSGSIQMLSPEDDVSDLRRRFKDLVCEVHLENTSAPHQMLSPADYSDLRRRFEALVWEVHLKECERHWLDHLTQAAASREKILFNNQIPEFCW